MSLIKQIININICNITLPKWHVSEWIADLHVIIMDTNSSITYI